MKSQLNSAAGLALLLSLLLVGRANAAVSVDIQPGDQTAPVGQTVVFNAFVITTAGETVTSYQWLMSPDNQNFTGVGSGATLTLNNAQTNQAGYYIVKVAYTSGSSQQTVSSPAVRLTVDVHPAILSQPASVTTFVGDTAKFGVAVGGALPLAFQWQHNGSNLVDNARVTGSTTTNLEIAAVMPGDAGNYNIVVTNRYGATNSQTANLLVAAFPPVITSATNAAGKQGYAFTNYTITATGSPPITFGANGLPEGLSVNPTNGVLSGIPSVWGIFSVTLLATNTAQVTSKTLIITLADDIPVITSATNALGKQGRPFSYTITATNDPVAFSAAPLPDGLSVDPVSGVISGVPMVSGSFAITLGVTNAYGADSKTLNLNLASGVPFITSPLAANGQQGKSFRYTIKTTNNPALFSADPLPDGLSLDPASGVISGVPLLNGSFAVTIGATNQFGSDNQTLALNLASGAPGITSPLTATGEEDQTDFRYTITASNSPTTLWASDLPTGLTVDTNTGAITGTPLYAGQFRVPLFAANAWGVGTATLQLTITNLAITNLVITGLMTNYLSPYLLEFTFSLRDGDDPLTSHAVVASPTLMTPTAFEDKVPVSPSETAVILQRVGTQDSKVLKGYLVLDFSASIASPVYGVTSNGLPAGVAAEVASAQDFVNQQPAGSQLGVYEFHRDDEAPQQVISLTTDKNLLDDAIAGIWTNYVQGFPAGSRAWDALGAAIGALGPANSDEIHYVLLMSDGNDDASTDTVDNVIAAATNANVQVYAVGFGPELNLAPLQTITSSTLGRYYPATNVTDLDLNFALVGKDLSSEYTLRWATLNRTATPFMPSFQISYQGITADSPTNPIYVSITNFPALDTNGIPLTNNSVPVIITQTNKTTNYIISAYLPSAYAGNILAGTLRLVSDADVHPAGITLRATYVPRYVRQLRLHYRANWPVSLTLNSTNPGEILGGWTVTQTNDGAGGQWALLSAPDPSNLAESIPFAAYGNLLTFSFRDPIAASNAFSEFDVDNTLYTNVLNTDFYGLTLSNASSFITYYDVPPPHGTPVPWLMNYGFTNDFANAELLDPNGNGLAVWQDYLAGLDPLDPNATFDTQLASSSNPPQISFNTVLGRTYRIEWATTLAGPWTTLRDGIAGTGGVVTFTDLRNLSDAVGMFYRVSVDSP